jgi:hypothetical protein
LKKPPISDADAVKKAKKGGRKKWVLTVVQRISWEQLLGDGTNKVCWKRDLVIKTLDPWSCLL